MPTREEIDQLQLPAGEPVMVLERRTFTSDGCIVEFARGIHAASRFAWTYTFKIPTEEPSVSTGAILPDALRADVEVLWDYHDMHHTVRRCDIGIGLGGHDLSVATYTAELFQQGMFPRIVFTRANAPTTVDRFPRGEAVHYREHAIELGVPGDAILIETKATNTRQNIEYTRKLLAAEGIEVTSAVLISRPYQQRRAYSTAKKLWPELEIVCASRPLPLDEYIVSIGDVNRVINMLVGDTTQRIIEYPKRGFAISQEMPAKVQAAYRRLVDAGFTSRLI
jgi:uncharacterized SAM-binding protein YcdF (DUF218 family)